MSKDFSYLKDWLTGEGYGSDYRPRPVILECIASRSGMSMSVYDREKLLYRINGCGFDRLGCALAEFLETCFMPDLQKLCLMAEPGPEYSGAWESVPGFYDMRYERFKRKVSLEGMAGLESMRGIADAVGLSVQVHETRYSTLLIITKKGGI